jgi:hypothetical protein
MAFEEPLAVAVVNAEAVLPVLMGWAFSRPTLAAAANAFQKGENVIHCGPLADLDAANFDAQALHAQSGVADASASNRLTVHRRHASGTHAR